MEEKRTPLQLSMDELAQKLSMLSFGIIGVICLIGIWQQRPWLDMFTIGGMYKRCSKGFFTERGYSISGGCCYTRRFAHCDYSYPCPWSVEDGSTKGHCEKTSFRRGSWFRFCDMFG